jgi:RimJ/RimL family protein N-acetyltransferase
MKSYLSQSPSPALIETERCYLRPFCLDDADMMFRLNSDPEVMRYTGDVTFDTLDMTEKFMKAYSDYSEYGFGRLMVCAKNDGRQLGWSGLKNYRGAVDVGYRFLKTAWGQGYCTEATLPCIAYGFEKLGLDRIIAHVLQPNQASHRVAEKLGLTVFKIDDYDGLGETFYYEILKSTYQLNRKYYLAGAKIL